jgi:hypothetical protein
VVRIEQLKDATIDHLIRNVLQREVPNTISRLPSALPHMRSFPPKVSHWFRFAGASWKKQRVCYIHLLSV